MTQEIIALGHNGVRVLAYGGGARSWPQHMHSCSRHATDSETDLMMMMMYVQTRFALHVHKLSILPPQSAKLRLRLATLETVIARPMANSGFLDKSALLTMACCETETDANACSPNAALPLSPYACLAAGERFWPHGSALNLEPCTYGDGSGACDQCHGLDTDSRFAVG